MTTERKNYTNNWTSEVIVRILFPIIVLGIAVLVIEEILNDISALMSRLFVDKPYSYIKRLFNIDDSRDE